MGNVSGCYDPSACGGRSSTTGPPSRPSCLGEIGVRCGVIAPIVWLTLIAAGDLYRGDIDPVVDYISELGERGSSTELVLRYGGFIFTGLLYLVVAAALPTVLAPRWKAAVVAVFVALEGIGRAGAGVYPCEPGCDGTSRAQQLHGLFATVGFCSGILASLAAGVLYRRAVDLALGIATTVFLLMLIWEDNPFRAAGLWERLATGALSVWLLLFAVWVMRGRHGQERRA